jgi:hypothetical protein
MAHVTFVHGIANKPPPDDLLRIWCRALADAADPLALGDAGVTTSLVYWADLMYEKPAEDLSAYEGVLETTAEAVDGGGAVAPPVPENLEQAAFLESLRSKLTTLDDAALDTAPPIIGESSETQGTLERIPLPWFLKKRFMNAFLRDVHHYLFDIDYGPPGRPAMPIRKTIRKRFIDAVCAPTVSRPHIVVAHSMGTVIAYDCLKQVDGCAPIDGLITIGSPLGLDEVQDKLRPGWSRNDGFPDERVAGKWVNIFDRLDPVCGFDPKLANDYRSKGLSRIEDLPVQNDGAWRHSATKYLRQPTFCAALRAMLEG